VTAPDMPALPNAGDRPWTDWGDGIQAMVAYLNTKVAALSPTAGPVVTVNGVTPDVAGNVLLGPDDVDAKPSDYAPSYADATPGSTFVVDKDPVTGFWPTSYDATGAAIYTSGAANAGTRPTARTDIVIVWRGADPSPASVASGTGGMLRGKDERKIPG
jgi:hypothetical protein